MSVPDRDMDTDQPLEIDTTDDVEMFNPDAPLSVNTGEVPEITEDDISEQAIDDVVSFEQQNALNEHVQDIVGSDDDDPNDVYKPDGTIYLEIDCFSDFCRGPAEIQQRLSKPVYVRGLPWKILAIPRDTPRATNGRPHRALGFFLQCNGDSDTVAWNCVASATLKVLSQADGIEDHSRRISHTFYPKENDWGYSQFLTCDHLANPDHGFIKDDTIKLVVHVAADAPHGVQWDSKKHAGYIGLKNQGATCYMNSILQTLFFTNKLRRAVYEMPTMPTGEDFTDNNVALAMQRVFYDLQHSDRPVGTKKLTKSFGWDSLETFMQHDVQELCRVLLDNLENKMKHSPIEDTIPNLFRGRMKSYINCTDVDFESSRVEDFYDIQLNIKGKNDIIESFREYIEVERLDGDNKYDAGALGMQPAEKGVKFLTFPPVLHLQLMRFQYDPTLDAMVKINDRFEFPDKLNLNEFTVNNGNGEDFTYCLHAVLVHSGDFHGGHYVVFINTNLTGPETKSRSRWCKFDDDVVSRATARDAIYANFGGDDNDAPSRTYTNAYMLVYVRQSCINDVLSSISEEDIPRHLRTRFENERTEEIRRKKEKMEAHLYTEVMFLTEQQMMRHHGFDLIDVRQVEDEIQKERVEKGMTVNDLYEYATTRVNSQQYGYRDSSMYDPNSVYNTGMIRLWKFDENSFKEEAHNTGTLIRFRPNQVLASGTAGDRTLDLTLENDRNLLYIEGPDEFLPPYDEQSDMLIFVKFFNAKTNELNIVGHILMCYKRPLSLYLAKCRKMAQLPEDAPLRFYEEVAPDRIRLVESHDAPLCSDNVLLEVNDGGILIFENVNDTTDECNAKAYLENIYNVIDVEIIMNTDSFLAGAADPEPNLNLQIGLDWSCNELTAYIGRHINYDPAMILLWRMSPFNERPTSYLINDHYATLRVREVLSLMGAQTHDPRRGKRYRLFYTKMPIRIADMDKRKQMKVQIMDEKMNIQEITIFPEKAGTVSNILEEARREFKFAPHGTGKLRLVYVGQSVHAMRVYQVFADHVSVQEISQKQCTPAYMFRVEEIPEDQLNMRPNEYLLPIAHFDKDPTRMFGVPFFFKVTHDEPLASVRDRIQKKLDVNDREFEKYKFALVASNRVVRYLDMESNSRVNLAELGHTHVTTTSHPYLGIDHMNKSRGSRSSHPTEKAIIIHN